MLNVERLDITREIILKIYENVTLYDIQRSAEKAIEYCERYECTNSELQNDYMSLRILHQFTHYMGHCNYEWMPISMSEFRDNIESELSIIEDKILDGWKPNFVIG